jgi:branched-chain amino acid transport system substrate-binding protein
MRRFGLPDLRILLAALALLLPPISPAESQPKGVIKVATQSPLSGGLGALGESIKLGTQLAIDQLKGPIETLGFKVELIPFDDQAKRDVGMANATNIVADKDILLVIGHLNSSVAIPASDVYKQASLAMISPANTNPMITDRKYLNVNRVIGRDDVQGIAAAEFAKTLGVKTAYVIHDQTIYGQGVAEFFRAYAKKHGIDVVGFEGTKEKSDFDPIIAPIKAKKPDLIFFGGIYDQMAPFFKQAREKGVKSTFLAPDGADSSDLTKIAGKAVVGMAGPVTVYPKAKKFAQDYKAKFGKVPEPFAVQAYDATAIGLKAVEAAIKEAGGKVPTREAVALNIRKTKHEGITGTTELDEKGDPKKSLFFVLRVASDDPAKWFENTEVNRIEVAFGSSSPPSLLPNPKPGSPRVGSD